MSDVDAELSELEREAIQAAIAAHCRPEDGDALEARKQAINALIEARYQSIWRTTRPVRD